MLELFINKHTYNQFDFNKNMYSNADNRRLKGKKIKNIKQSPQPYILLNKTVLHVIFCVILFASNCYRLQLIVMNVW